MRDLSSTAKFRTLAAETIRAVNQRGLEVMPIVVTELLAVLGLALRAVSRSPC